jgi:hypothetical protein
VVKVKKLLGMTAVGVAVGAVCLAAWAASIANLSGQSCGTDTGTWHFVNNQTGGAGQGTLSATWSSGNTCTVSASKVLGSTQHFYCTASGALTSAVTDLPGKLVLSDFSCTCTDKSCEPPPCDPQKEVCPK